MKTTVEISEALLEEAKAIAADQQVTLQALVEAGLRHEVEVRKISRPFQLRDETFDGDGFQSGLTRDDWEQLRDAAYDGRGTFADLKTISPPG